jgi:hypothetical protein
MEHNYIYMHVYKNAVENSDMIFKIKHEVYLAPQSVPLWNILGVHLSWTAISAVTEIPYGFPHLLEANDGKILKSRPALLPFSSLKFSYSVIILPFNTT